MKSLEFSSERNLEDKLYHFRDGPLEKLWGGGGFSSSMNFFSLMFPLNEYFFSEDVVHEYFFFLEVTLN